MTQSKPAKRLESAKAQAETSRARLRERITELRARTRPAVLIDNARTLALTKAIDLATRQPRARSVIAAGAVTAGLAYLFRKPLLKALARRFAPGDKT